MNRQFFYNWIKEKVSLHHDAKEFAKEFSLHSMSVERTDAFVQRFSKVITAKIVKIDQHPNADRLKLVTVDTGKEERVVVCGAPNVNVGLVAALASEGSVVVDATDVTETFTLKKAKIRGVESDGMLCGADELGFGGDHAGILLLPATTEIGVPLEKLVEFGDVVFDIEITTNRPDAMSVLGLAREAAAVFGVTSHIPESKIEGTIDHDYSLSVNIDDVDGCKRYEAIVVENIVVEPSPLWMQLRLLAAGMKPINNIVDITNYVLLEYGQPMHAFDYNKIKGAALTARKAKKGEKMVALDGETYELTKDDTVIADAEGVVAIAGVMGGLETGVTSETTAVVFEAATFNPLSVRRTARRLHLHSESSSLFEKGLHSAATTYALVRAVELAQMLTAAKLGSEILDANPYEYEATTILFDSGLVSRHLGIDLSHNELEAILAGLGIEIDSDDEGVLRLNIPWWRSNDLIESHDILEEVARLYGYHNLPMSLPTGVIPVIERDPILHWEEKIKFTLAGIGFSELFHYSMVSEGLQKKLDLFSGAEVIISNPLNEEMTRMRTSLVPQILETIAENQHRFSNQLLFELSNAYRLIKAKDLPEEIPLLTGVATGNDAFHEAKGAVEFLLKKLGVSGYAFETPKKPFAYWQDQQVLSIVIDGKEVGYVGVLSAETRRSFDIDQSVALFDFEIKALIPYCSSVSSFDQISEYPSVERDLSVLVDMDTPWSEIEQVVSSSDKLVQEVLFLNVFEDDELKTKSKKSVAFRMEIRSDEKTLTSEEVDAIIKKTVSLLEKKCGATVR